MPDPNLALRCPDRHRTVWVMLPALDDVSISATCEVCGEEMIEDPNATWPSEEPATARIGTPDY